jgi:hypothetical protein
MMNSWMLSMIFVAWYASSLIISESLGKSRKMGVEWSFFFCFMLSPVLGLLLVLVSKKR